MNILFLSDNFPPEVNAPASRTFEHCREWVKAGHAVTVICTAPNFPKGELLAGYRNKLWQWETMDGVRVLRVWTYITANAGFAKRTLDYLSFMVSGFLAGLMVRRPDVIVGTSPQFFTNCAGWMLSVFRRRPFVFELRDLWPESIKTVGAMRDSVALRAMERLELFLYRKANAVVAVTESFRRNLISRGIDGDKIHVVTNGVDLSRFHPLKRDETLVAQLGLSTPQPTVIPARMPESSAMDGNAEPGTKPPTAVILARMPESSAMDGNAELSTKPSVLSVRAPSLAIGTGIPTGATAKPLFVAGYIGTHGMAHALETVLEAARLVRQHPEGAKVVIHEAEEGGYWAEVPSIPGCATQGETFDELLTNLYEAVEGCLAVDLEAVDLAPDSRVMEIAV